MNVNTCKDCVHFRSLFGNRKQGSCECHSGLHYLDDSCEMFAPSYSALYQLVVLKITGALERCICNGAFREIAHKTPDFRCAFRGRMVDDFRYNLLFSKTLKTKVIEDIIGAMSIDVLQAIEERGDTVYDYEIDAFTDYESPIAPRIIMNLYRK